MRFSIIAPALLAAVAKAATTPVQSPEAGPFWLTFVMANGTEYPCDLGGASRGYVILADAEKYDGQFTFEADSSRLTGSSSEEQDVGYADREREGPEYPILFSKESRGWWFTVAQVNEDSGSDTFIVHKDSATEGAQGWQISAPHDDLKFNAYWTGVDNKRANAKLRVDTEKPARK